MKKSNLYDKYFLHIRKREINTKINIYKYVYKDKEQN